MNEKKGLSLKVKFGAALGIALVMVLGGAFYLTQRAVVDALAIVSENLSRHYMAMLERDIRMLMLSGHGSELREHIKSLERISSNVHVRIFPRETTPPSPELAVSNLKIHKTLKVYSHGECVKCHTSGEKIATVEITVDNTSFSALITHARYLILLLGLIAVTGAFGMVYFYFDRYVDRPIKEVVTVLNEVKRGNLSARLDTTHAEAAEFSRLMKDLNNTLTTLEALIKQREEEYSRQIQRADRLATVGQLASAIAHEIKNPLAGISGAIQVLKEDLTLDTKNQEIFDEIIRQISRVAKTVNDLLSMAKEVSPRFEEVDLHQLLNRIITLLEQQAQKHGIEVIQKLDPDVGFIMADPEQLQQVLLNIILNAVQAMPSGGRLTLETEMLLLEKEKVKIKITDTGCGIREEMMERIFEPFFTTKPQGTGLGLFTAKRIVELHGGSIHLESETGKGTTVTIILPVRHWNAS